MPVDPGHGERLAQRVSTLYAGAELSLLRRIARALAANPDSSQWAVDKLAQIEYLRRAMASDVAVLDQQAVGDIEHVITTAWTRGQASAVADLDGLGLDVRIPQSRDIGLRRIADETLRVIAPVGRRLLRASLDVYTQTVAEASSTVLLGANTRRDAAQQALDRLTSQGVRGFTDRAGRDWTAESYVEMATRTGTGKAAVEGHVEQLQANGLDLVMVSDSPRECKLCRPWEGKVLATRGGSRGTVYVQSLTGDEQVKVDVAGTLDEARRAGFQHPNCRHSVSAYLPGASRLPTNTADTEKRVAQEQRQRTLERNVRKWKTRQATALTPEAERKAKAKVRQWQGQIREHLAATDGLDRKPAREQVGKAR